ncbi:MAG: MbtH domain protein [Bacteroidota bacterium]
MDSLVKRLSSGSQSVEASLRPERTAAELQEAIGRELVHIRFTETRGGTELGVALDMDRTDTGNADFAKGQGTVHLEGTLSLNYVPVRCVADIDLESLEGTGRLVVENEAPDLPDFS